MNDHERTVALIPIIYQARNIQSIVWLSVATILLIFVQWVYIVYYVAKPIARLSVVVERHEKQIGAVISSMQFSDSFHAKIMERLNEPK